MDANSEGSGETARMRKLAWAFAGRLCDKYHNLMSWLIWQDHRPQMKNIASNNQWQLLISARNEKSLSIFYHRYETDQPDTFLFYASVLITEAIYMTV